MEDIEQKLNSGNIFLQTQVITTLNETILKKTDTSSIFESDEVKTLWKIANGGDWGVSTLAVETLIGLVMRGLIPAPATLQNFIADLGSSKSPTALMRGITQLFLLLCEAESENEQLLTSPFSSTQTGVLHPYVLIIKRRPDLAEAVVEEVQFILYHQNPIIQRSWATLLEPFIYYNFCFTENTPPSAKSLMNLLVSSHQVLGKPLISLLSKILTLIKVESESHFERKLFVLCGLTKIALTMKLSYLSAALLPCLVICLPRAIKYGFSTRTVETYMIALASQLGQGCDVTICALAEAIPFASGQLQVNLLRVGATLLSHKDGNPLVGSRLLPSLLQILSASCSAVIELTNAASVLVSLIQALPAQASSNAQLAGNEYWETLSLSFPDLATYVPSVDLCNQIVKDPQCSAEWLTKLASTVYQISKFHYTIVTAVFIYQGSTSKSVQEAIKVLQREVLKCHSLSFELFPIILYRLGREPDPPTRLQLLYFLPKLAVNKLSVPMILKTLLALWSSISLKPLILRLLLDVWKIEPRVHSYLFQLIQDKNVSTLEIEIAKAYVVVEICRLKPSQHGEEYLPLLSAFLTENRGKEGTPQTMIALDGIYELCSAVVIDLRTTWKVIGPKLVKDKRAEVIIKLCKLLSLTPKLPIRSKEYEEFTEGVASILWGWAASKIKNSVNEAAFKALEKFDPEFFKLKMLPTYAREGHKLPDKMAATPFEAARKAEDVLTYVPGLAWVKLAVGCPKAHAIYVESLIKAVVERELAALPKGIYMTAIQEAKRKGYRSSGGQPEPLTYNFLAETSFLRASVVFLQDFSKHLIEAIEQTSDEGEKLLQGVTILLVSLGQSLNRPFPALDWSFLNEVHSAGQKWDSLHPGDNWVTKIRHGLFRVTAQQCNKSASALNVISKWLTPSSSLLTRQDQIYLFGLLDQLGRGLNPQTLQDFVTHVFTESMQDNNHLKLLLEALKPHLTCSYVHDSNRNVMSNAIEGLNEKIDPMNESLYAVYKSCVADLPQKQIERLTSPSLWWEVTDEKLYRAAVLRCHVAAKDPEKVALPWLNDLVDSAATLPGDRSHFLLVMADTLVARSEAEESSAWLLSLLGRLRDHLKKQPGDNLVLAHEHQQRIIFYMDILVLGLMIWSGLWATCSMSKLSSSHLTRNSLLTASLVSLNGRADWAHALPQLLNWLVSCHSQLSPYMENRYHIKPPMLLLASLSSKLSQSMWNKVISMVM